MYETLLDMGRFLLMAGIVGLLAHVLGEALPRTAFSYQKFPYKPYAWEQQGKFYSKLAIERWKNKLPDKSRVVKSTVEKSLRSSHGPAQMERLIQETCVAELVHWVLLIISPLFLLVLHTPVGILVTAIYGLSNLPFIMIQRYNRPRLVRMHDKLLKSGSATVLKTTAVQQKGGVCHEAAGTF